MNKPVFRNPDLYQVLPWRDWMRENLPGGGAGMVVEDMDIVLRRYGPLANWCRDGTISFIEVKTFSSFMGRAQEMTFGLIDRLMRKADPDEKYYKGYYVIRWNPPHYAINECAVTEDELKQFFVGERSYPSYFDSPSVK